MALMGFSQRHRVFCRLLQHVHLVMESGLAVKAQLSRECKRYISMHILLAAWASIHFCKVCLGSTSADGPLT